MDSLPIHLPFKLKSPDPRSGQRGLETAFNLAVFIVFAALWLAFSLAVVVDSERIEETWKAFRDLPIVGQALLATPSCGCRFLDMGDFLALRPPACSSG